MNRTQALVLSFFLVVWVSLQLMGPDRPVGWLTVEDLAVIAATAFGDPDRFIGGDLALASDVQSIDDCRGDGQATPTVPDRPQAVRAAGRRGGPKAAPLGVDRRLPAPLGRHRDHLDAVDQP